MMEWSRPARARLVATLALAAAFECGFAGTAESAARVALLPAGPGASVVVELNGDVPDAKRVDPTDDRTIAVEIGPVRDTVLNQLLQAAKDSPIVDHVRLRASAQAGQGTRVTIQVSTKQPVIGTVRRAARRLYIDLTPRDAVPPVPARSATAAVAATRPPAPPPAPPRKVVSPPVPTQATPAQPAPTNAPASAALPSNAVGQPAATRTAASPLDLDATAAQLAKAADVRGLERLRRDLEAQRSAPTAATPDAASLDAALARLDAFILEAQRNRLAADAALLRGDPVATSGRGAAAGAASARASNAPVDPAVAVLRTLRPDLERVARAAAAWTGGKPPSELLTLSAMLPRFRAQRPPAPIAPAHASAVTALDQLALTWASASADPPPEGSPPPVVQRIRAALDEYLAQEKSLGTKN